MVFIPLRTGTGDGASAPSTLIKGEGLQRGSSVLCLRGPENSEVVNAGKLFSCCVPGAQKVR